MRADEYERCSRDCKIGIKAFQNVNASVLGFARLVELETVNDPILLPSIFYWAVIRYSKPFLRASTESGQAKYPIKNLKKINGFSVEMHDHLITIRNTLVAHDDFDQITPHILYFGIAFDEEKKTFIPTSIVVSNKCLSFPVDTNIVRDMLTHAQAALAGIQAKLQNDLDLLRKIIVENPGIAKDKSKYTKNYGREEIGPQKGALTPPDFSNDEWLNTKVPDYSNVHAGFVYEEARIRRDFHVPERITLPNGQVIEIKPSGLIEKNKS